MDQKKASARSEREGGSLLFTLTLFLLLGTLSFGLGRLSALEAEKDPVRVEYDFSYLPEHEREVDDLSQEIPLERGFVVGSQNSDVYHLPWCSGAQRITSGNRVVFESRSEAEEAGYRPAENCPGLGE